MNEDTTTICPKCGHMEFTTTINVEQAIRDAFHTGLTTGAGIIKDEVSKSEPFDKEEIVERSAHALNKVLTKYLYPSEPTGGDIK